MGSDDEIDTDEIRHNADFARDFCDGDWAARETLEDLVVEAADTELRLCDEVDRLRSDLQAAESRIEELQEALVEIADLPVDTEYPLAEAANIATDALEGETDD